jgi:hypothetical protein
LGTALSPAGRRRRSGATAQNWHHLVFNPTNTDPHYSGAAAVLDVVRFQRRRPGDQYPMAVGPVRFHRPHPGVISSYDAIMKQPLDPFVVARNRPGALQWYVVTKMLTKDEARRIAINFARQPEFHGKPTPIKDMPLFRPN